MHNELTTIWKMHLLFVHHGSHFPPYIVDCLRQVRVFNPKLDVRLILDEVCFSHVLTQRLIPDEWNILLINSKTIAQSSIHKAFEQQSLLDRTFREGFWHYCSKRFATLLDYIRQEQLQHVFHMEYDNMLYASIQDVLSSILSLSPTVRMAGVIDSDTQCIPSFLYFADCTPLEELVVMLINHRRDISNDMDGLAKFRALCPHVFNCCLPVMTDDFASRLHLSSKSYLYEQSTQFPMLFDGRAVGQYLGGVDPRNIPGDTRGFVNQDTAFRVDRLQVEWVTDDEWNGQRVNRPYVCGRPLANLHVHSKALAAWSSSIPQ